MGIVNANTLDDPQSLKDIPSIVRWLKKLYAQINRLSSESINAYTTSSTGPPPANSVTIYAQGDFIRNEAPTVQGSAGSHYVVTGWLCVAGGKPGTWVECRSATGT